MAQIDGGSEAAILFKECFVKPKELQINLTIGIETMSDRSLQYSVEKETATSPYFLCFTSSKNTKGIGHETHTHTQNKETGI